MHSPRTDLKQSKTVLLFVVCMKKNRNMSIELASKRPLPKPFNEGVALKTTNNQCKWKNLKIYLLPSVINE